MLRTPDGRWDEVGAPVARVGSSGDTRSCQIPPWEESKGVLQGLLGSGGWGGEVGGEKGVPSAREDKLEGGSQTLHARGRTLPRTDALEGSLGQGAWVFAQQVGLQGGAWMTLTSYANLWLSLSLLGAASGETGTGRAHLPGVN